MKHSIIANLGFISWTAGMLFLMLSNSTAIISKTPYTRTGWKKYRMGFTIREISEVIEMIDDDSLRRKLERKILWRRIGYGLMIIAPALIFAG